ncbi:MAG: hypothetical protein ACOYB1_09935 [Limnohabitans sp.]
MTKKKQYPWTSDAERAAVVPDTRSPAEKRLHQLVEAESVPELCGSDYSQALYKAALKLAAPVQVPLFWYRPCSNGMYEGPIHNAQIEDVRKQSGAWIPLVPAIPSPPTTPAQEPVAWMYDWESEGEVVRDWVSKDYDEAHCSTMGCHNIRPLYTTPPAAPLPQPFPQEAAAFQDWFNARWLGDGEMGEAIPSQSDPQFPIYMNEYTLGFGAWMAAKHAAHGIKKGGAA